MPTLAQLLTRKASRLDNVPDDFASFVGGIQPEVYDELLRLLSTLEIVNGKYALTEANLAKVEVIVQQLNTFLFNTEYLVAVTNFAAEFNTQAILNNDIMKAFFQGFEEKELYLAALRRSQATAIDLLNEAGVDQAFLTPLRESLTDSITTEQGIVEANIKLRNQIIGTEETEGLLLRHTKQVARDGFTISDRTYTTAIANDLNMEWFKYVGGRIKDSRDFCVTDKVGVFRLNQFFHRNEVSEWGNIKQWQGRINITDSNNIFILAGGWNCLHSIQPVSITIVPQDVIDRNIANGNFVS